MHIPAPREMLLKSFSAQERKSPEGNLRNGICLSEEAGETISKLPLFSKITPPPQIPWVVSTFSCSTLDFTWGGGNEKSLKVSPPLGF